jgi:hypothetical protein
VRTLYFANVRRVRRSWARDLGAGAPVGVLGAGLDNDLGVGTEMPCSLCWDAQSP